MRLQDDFLLRTAGVYGLVRSNQAQPLVLVYGDFFVTSTAEELGGTTPAVLVDQDHLIYLVNDAPSHPDIPYVYVNGTLQAQSSYLYVPRIDDGGGREVALLQFSLDSVLGAEISVRMKGKVDGNNVLITNPITAIQDAFVNHGNWFAPDFDSTTCSEAARLCDQLGYTIHWAFSETKSYKQHLVELAPHYHMDHILTIDSTLALLLDVGRHLHEDKVWPALVDLRDMAGEDPSDSLEYDMDERNLVNEVTVRYQYSWVTGEYAAQRTLTDDQSIAYYDRRAKSIDLPGIRSEEHLETWQRFFFERYSGVVGFPAIVSFDLNTLLHLGLTPGVYTKLNWAWGPDPLGRGWTDRVVKVLNTSYSLMRQQQHVECFDIGVLDPPENSLVLLDQTGKAWYFSASPSGALDIADAPPFFAFSTPIPVHWIQQLSPNGTTYYFYPTPAPGEAHQAGIVVDTSPPPIGSGLAAIPLLIDRRFQRWLLTVTDRGGYALRPTLADTSILPSAVAMLDSASGLWYLRVLSDGSPEFSTSVTGAVLNPTETWTYIQRTDVLGVVWYLSPSPFGEPFASTASPGGTGTAQALTLTDETRALWTLQVDTFGTFSFERVA